MSDTYDSIEMMKNITALCKRRGFVFPASDIYGGINGFWDFGPLGSILKNNIRDEWWKAMVLCPPIGPNGEPVSILGLDSALIQNPKTWVASGHVAGFNDPMVDCRETKLRYRADNLDVYVPKSGDGVIFAWAAEEIKPLEKKIKKLGEGKTIADYDKAYLTDIDVSEYSRVVGPDTNTAGTLTEPKMFNLMFETYVGATRSEDSKAYLRPETAQGCFLNYKNYLSSSRVKVPFGIAQIGKAFRNEVNPRNFIYRSREFEQMEMEWFCPPDEAQMWFDFWKEARMKWWKDMGVSEENLRFRAHDQDELSHYAKEGAGTVDVEYRFPFTMPDFGELEGIAHRTDFDLKAHQEHSGTKHEYLDDSGNRYVPHVIEPAAGLTRALLTILCEAYTYDESRPSKEYLRLAPKLAPVKAAILPLTKKDGLPEIAQKIYMDLRQNYHVQMDAGQSIGKRYARQDEIGTPFCMTVDYESKDDNCVTVRDRDTLEQERVSIDKIKEFLASKI
jgi:glycyl-tRNA synthetase